MFPNVTPAGSRRLNVPPAAPVSNWSVALYRKAENVQSSFYSYESSQVHISGTVSGAFYIQLQHQADPTSPSCSDVLYCRYRSSKSDPLSPQLPFTISQINNFTLKPETAPTINSGNAQASKFYNAEQSVARIGNQSEDGPVLLLCAKAFLGILVLNSSVNNIHANDSGLSKAYMIFVTEENYLGQLFDAHIYRIAQVATISLRDCPEDENLVSGIKKLFQGRCFYYSSYARSDSHQSRNFFDKPYDITLCAQRMAKGHDSDNRFFWNRGLSLPLLKYNVDARYWIPKVMCGGIEKYRSQKDHLDLWLISRMSCERAGTRFNVRGVNDDGAVGNFVETEQIVIQPHQKNYSSFLIVRGSIPLFWQQPRVQVAGHRIIISRSEALSFRAFFEHFRNLYRHYGRVLILNLVERRSQEKHIGNEYYRLFDLLVKTYRQTVKYQSSNVTHLSESDFMWFEYHEQARTNRNSTSEQFVQDKLINNAQYGIQQTLRTQGIFTYLNGITQNVQEGIFRINCIDCLDRTNSVQLVMGLNVLLMQLESLKIVVHPGHLQEHLRKMWINNGDHISRIYTGTGALGQSSKAKDIQRSFGRAIQNTLRDDDKQQSMETLIYTYSKDSFLHERVSSGLFTPYMFSDGSILNELFNFRQRHTRKEKFRVAIGTWNINGDKNPSLNDSYRSILDAWILNGPENLNLSMGNASQIPTKGYKSEQYEKSLPDILAIGFQEICDLTASNIVSASSDNARRWVNNIENHFKKSCGKDEYILLGDDQLVGVCLAVFIRRDLAPFIRNIAVESVKTGMGGKLGNKGCVAIRFFLHNTSICFICAHFTAGQNEFNERNRDFKTILEKLSFSPPSRALWHDHIFFLGDFNYRLNAPRYHVEQWVKAGDYHSLLQCDQLKREQYEQRVFREFHEGPIQFPPTYKYDVGSDIYDTSEKARIPSYTDRILYRNMSDNVQNQLVYYGRAEVKTSDHRPVSALIDAEVEICDEEHLYRDYMNMCERLRPSNALVIYDMRASVSQRKNQVMEEVEVYVKRKYGQNINFVDRYFLPNHEYLSLHIFFENGEQARRVMDPVEDELPSGIWFKKRLIDTNDYQIMVQKLNLLFSNPDETMFPKSIEYDLGSYQQPARESLSTTQETIMDNLAPIEDTFIGNNEDNRQDTKNLELMSFDPEHPVLSNSISHPDLMDSLQITNTNNSFHHLMHSASMPRFTNTNDNARDLLSFDPAPDVNRSKFYVDPFEIVTSSSRPTASPSPMSQSPMTLQINNKNNNSQNKNSQPFSALFVPTRPAPPPPINISSRSNVPVQRPLTLDNLNLNPASVIFDPNADLLDLGDPGSPPPSPKFDPLG